MANISLSCSQGASKEIQEGEEKDHLLVDQGPCRELSKTMLLRVQSLAQRGLQRLPDYNRDHNGDHDYTGKTTQCDYLGGTW